MHLILGHDRPHGWQVGHLMPLWLAICPVQGMLTARAARRLDWKHRLHRLQRDQRSGLTVMPRLSAGLAPTGAVALPWSVHCGGITRRRLRGVLRVHPQPLQQPLHCGLQRRNTCFERTDICLRFGWCAFPHFW